MTVNGSIDLPITGGGGGSGDVVGPGSGAVDNDIAVFDGITGKLIKDGGYTIAQILAAASGTPNNIANELVQRDSSSYFDTTRIYYDRVNGFAQYIDLSAMSFFDNSNQLSLYWGSRQLFNVVGTTYMDWSGNSVSGVMLPSSIPLYFQAADASGFISISAPGGVSTYTMLWPAAQAGSPGQVLTNSDAAGTLTWTTPSSGGTPTFVSINSDQAVAYNTVNSVDCSGGSVNLTFPDPSIQGNFIFVKDTTGSAQTNNIRMVQFNSEAIEGIPDTKILQTNWGSWTFYSNGTSWFMI